MKRSQGIPLSLPRTLGAWGLLLPGVVAFQPTFGGVMGYAAALIGITVGVAISLVAARFRFGAAFWFAAVLGSYLLLGGPLVLPDTTILGFIPSLETLRGLVLLIFRSWNDLLTVATPAGDIPGPAAVPLLSGLVAGAVLGAFARNTRAVHAPMLIPVTWLGVSIAFGVRTAPTATWLGAALGVGILVWLTAHRLAATRVATSQILLNKDRGLSRVASKALAAGIVIVLAASVAIGVNVLSGQRANRHVLRDDVVPPLNLHELTSPLMSYRLYELTQKDEVLFRVDGMPDGTRLRLAVLDTYDGNVFNVSQQTSQYLNVGRELPWSPATPVASATVTAVSYDDVWVPTFGRTSRVDFSGPDARGQGKGLYFNKLSYQLLTTAGLSDGTGMRLQAEPIVQVPADQRDAFKAAGAGSAPLATVSRVPDALVKAATDWTAEATSAYGQLDAIARKLQDEGFYSDGQDGKSRSGHTAERLGTMFNSPQWIGDDEQYATAMALMATQLGIPARVVMGFYPEGASPAGGAWEVKGTEAHVWVEANLDGAGWLSFDPTPPRDKVPQTDVPKPKPKPKPQIDPPPDPPEKLPDDPVVADQDAVKVDDEENKDNPLWGYLMVAGMVLGGAAIVASPFLVIAGLKHRRSTRRRTFGEVTDQLAGAWDDVVDRARDLGYVAPTSRTRREAADSLQSAFPDVAVTPLAHQVDASIFGAGAPDEARREDAWHEAGELKGALLATTPWYRRPAALLSVKSLRRRRTEAALESRNINPLRRPRRGRATEEQTKESR